MRAKNKLDLFSMFSLADGYLRMVTVGGLGLEGWTSSEMFDFFPLSLPSSSSSTADSTDRNVSDHHKKMVNSFPLDGLFMHLFNSHQSRCEWMGNNVLTLFLSPSLLA